jgi:hypothetical protein
MERLFRKVRQTREPMRDAARRLADRSDDRRSEPSDVAHTVKAEAARLELCELVARILEPVAPYRAE